MRTIATAVTCVTALLAVPGQAAPPKPHIVDARGDYVPASGDIVSATFSTVVRTGSRVPDKLRITLRLAEKPAANVPQTYNVIFAFAGCEQMSVAFYWSGGVPNVQQESFLDSSLCADKDAPVITATKVREVEAAVAGTNVVWTVPLVDGLRPGLALTETRALTSSSGLLRSPIGGNFFVDTPYGDVSPTGHDYTIR